MDPEDGVDNGRRILREQGVQSPATYTLHVKIFINDSNFFASKPSIEMKCLQRTR